MSILIGILFLQVKHKQPLHFNLALQAAETDEG